MMKEEMEMAVREEKTLFFKMLMESFLITDSCNSTACMLLDIIILILLFNWMNSLL